MTRKLFERQYAIVRVREAHAPTAKMHTNVQTKNQTYPLYRGYNIIAAGTIIHAGNITCTQGQTSLHPAAHVLLPKGQFLSKKRIGGKKWPENLSHSFRISKKPKKI